MSRIISIVKQQINDETLWNLAVQDDQSYIANGVVVHNCDSYLLPILKGNLGNKEITGIKKGALKYLDMIQFSEACGCKHDC